MFLMASGVKADKVVAVLGVKARIGVPRVRQPKAAAKKQAVGAQAVSVKAGEDTKTAEGPITFGSKEWFEFLDGEDRVLSAYA